jgi:hypothetical protein
MSHNISATEGGLDLLTVLPEFLYRPPLQGKQLCVRLR